MTRKLMLVSLGLGLLLVDLLALGPLARREGDEAKRRVARTGVPLKLGDGDRWVVERSHAFRDGVLPAIAGDEVRIDAFTRDTSGNLTVRQRTPGSPPSAWGNAEAIGVRALSNPAVVALGGGRRMVFFRGEDDCLNYVEYDGRSRHPWRPVCVDKFGKPDGLRPMADGADPSAVLLDAQARDVMILYRGVQDELVAVMREHGLWSTTFRSDVRLQGTPTAIASAREVHVMYREVSNRGYIISWQRAQHQFKAPEGGGDSVFVGCSPVVTMNPADGEQVGYYCGEDGKLWFTHYPDRPGGRWGSAPHDTGIAAVAAAVPSGGLPEVYFTDGDAVFVEYPVAGWMRQLVGVLAPSIPALRWVTNIHLWPTHAPTALAHSGSVPCACQRE